METFGVIIKYWLFSAPFTTT